MTIILDFDHTIFDTQRFRNAYPIVKRIETVLWNHGDLSEFIFNDVTPFLEKHQEHTLILMTYGNKTFQRTKVKDSHIDRFFDDIMLTGLELKGKPIKRMLEEQNYTKPIVFVDDKLQQLDSVSSLCPSVEIVRIKRPGQPNSTEERCNNCHEVTNMKELSTLLKTLDGSC